MGIGKVQEDIAFIVGQLRETLLGIEGSSWVITGGAGFLGAYFLDLIHFCNENLFRKPCQVLCLENFSSGTPRRIQHLEKSRFIKIIRADVVKPVKVKGEVDYIIHAASIASPTYYRKYPLQTIEANVMGLRNLLEMARDKKVRSFLSFSSSEVYGDPPAHCIPTPETYNGNVSPTGPRACYDESKRLGETLAVSYFREYGVPVKIVRPFNVYGPGLKLDDGRVLPDFFRGVLEENVIRIYSDGTTTRSFCYIRDAVTGFCQTLFSNYDGQVFNIGNDSKEICIKDLADMVAELVGGVQVVFAQSSDDHYLTDNPQRRCPDLSKARKLLRYQPQVDLAEGLARTWTWYRQEAEGVAGQ